MSPTRLLTAILTCLLITITATSCRKSVIHTSSSRSTVPDTLIPGTVIKSAGTWSATNSKGSRKLEVTVSGNSISWSVESRIHYPGGGSSGGSSSSGMSISSPSDPWFVFVESPQRLWFFNGKDELNYSLSEGGGSRGGPAIISGKLHSNSEDIPPELVLLLPAELQKLLPPVEPPVKRPSL